MGIDNLAAHTDIVTETLSAATSLRNDAETLPVVDKYHSRNILLLSTLLIKRRGLAPLILSPSALP